MARWTYDPASREPSAVLSEVAHANAENVRFVHAQHVGDVVLERRIAVRPHAEKFAVEIDFRVHVHTVETQKTPSLRLGHVEGFPIPTHTSNRRTHRAPVERGAGIKWLCFVCAKRVVLSREHDVSESREVA